MNIPSKLEKALDLIYEALHQLDEIRELADGARESLSDPLREGYRLLTSIEDDPLFAYLENFETPEDEDEPEQMDMIKELEMSYAMSAL